MQLAVAASISNLKPDAWPIMADKLQHRCSNNTQANNYTLTQQLRATAIKCLVLLRAHNNNIIVVRCINNSLICDEDVHKAEVSGDDILLFSLDNVSTLDRFQLSALLAGGVDDEWLSPAGSPCSIIIDLLEHQPAICSFVARSCISKWLLIRVIQAFNHKLAKCRCIQLLPDLTHRNGSQTSNPSSPPEQRSEGSLHFSSRCSVMVRR